MYARTLSLLALLSACTTPEMSDAPEASVQRVVGQTDGGSGDHVEAVDCAPGGSPQVIARGSVQADGSFSLRVPVRRTRFALRVVSAAGAQVEAGLVDWSGATRNTIITAGELSDETSVEAAVWLSAQAHSAGEEVSTVDVRAWIDAEVAAAVEGAQDSHDATEGLGLAVLASAEAEAEAWAHVGVTASTEAWFRARAQAMVAVQAAADAGADAETVATLTAEAMIDAAASLGAEAQEAAQAHAQASFAFATTAEATISDSVVVDAALHASASAHAHLVANATTSILTAAHASQGAIQAGAQAGADLITDIDAASDASARADAWASFQASLVGDSHTSVLGQSTNLSVAGHASVDAALTVCATAEATADATLEATAQAFIAAGDAIDIVALAEATVDAAAAVDATITASFSGLVGVSRADAAMSARLWTIASAD